MITSDYIFITKSQFVSVNICEIGQKLIRADVGDIVYVAEHYRDAMFCPGMFRLTLDDCWLERDDPRQNGRIPLTMSVREFRTSTYCPYDNPWIVQGGARQVHHLRGANRMLSVVSSNLTVDSFMTTAV